MANLHIQINVQMTPRVFRWGLTVLLLSAASTELSSESVTLTTFYPAPSGIYAQMITTGNTWLARNNGMVGIGTDNPQAKLDINGAVRLKHYPVSSETTDPELISAANGTLHYDGSDPYRPNLRIKHNGLWRNLGMGPLTYSVFEAKTLPGDPTDSSFERTTVIGPFAAWNNCGLSHSSWRIYDGVTVSGHHDQGSCRLERDASTANWILRVVVNGNGDKLPGSVVCRAICSTTL